MPTEKPEHHRSRIMKKYLRSLGLFGGGLVIGLTLGVAGALSAREDPPEVRYISGPVNDPSMKSYDGREMRNPKRLAAYQIEGIVPYAPGQDPASKQVLGPATGGGCKAVVRTYFSDGKVNISALVDPVTNKVDSVAIFAPIQVAAKQ